GVATCMRTLGDIAYEMGDRATAKRHYQGSQLLYEHLGDQRASMETLILLAAEIRDEGDLDQAEQMLFRAATLAQSLGERLAMGNYHWEIGILYGERNLT